MYLQEFSKNLSGKWVAVGGNRWINKKIAKKIEIIVEKLIRSRCKIVTGGAEGADHVAMYSCLKYKIQKNSLKVFLPYTIQKQYQHYCKLEGDKKANLLLQTLLEIKKYYPNSIIGNNKKFQNYRQAANYRNTLIIKQADSAIFFDIKGSIGSLDAVKKIKAKGIPYLIF